MDAVKDPAGMHTIYHPPERQPDASTGWKAATGGRAV